MRFRLVVLLAFAVAVIVGTKPYYAQDGLFDDAAEPAAEAVPADIFADPKSAADDDLDDLFDDPKPARDAETDDVINDPTRAADANKEKLVDDAKPVHTLADDDLFDELGAESQSRKLLAAVFRLKEIRADQAAATVREIFSDRMHEGLKLNADPQQNLIVMRGPADLLKRVQALLRALESGEAGNKVASANEQSEKIRQKAFSSLATSQLRNASVENALQQELRELVGAHRSMKDRNSDAYDASGDQARKIADELRAVVQRAFETRQQQQQQQVQQLQQRLAALQKRVQEREQKRQRIIEQAVNDLLSNGTPNSQVSRRRQRLLDAFGSIGHVTTPEAALREPQSQRHNPLKQSLNTGTEDQNTNDFGRARQMMRKGYVAEKQLSEFQAKARQAEHQVQAQVEKRQQLQAKYLEQLQAATIATQADLEASIKGLELDLAEAEAELAYSTEEYEAVKTLHKKSATSVSASQLRKLALQHRQALIKVERAKLELDAAMRQNK